jgi:hypothetical protein
VSFDPWTLKVRHALCWNVPRRYIQSHRVTSGFDSVYLLTPGHEAVTYNNDICAAVICFGGRLMNMAACIELFN